jgi:hypothetical protein
MAAESYAVNCPHCTRGYRADGSFCDDCAGTGKMQIPEAVHTINRFLKIAVAVAIFAVIVYALTHLK